MCLSRKDHHNVTKSRGKLLKYKRIFRDFKAGLDWFSALPPIGQHSLYQLSGWSGYPGIPSPPIRTISETRQLKVSFQHAQKPYYTTKVADQLIHIFCQRVYSLGCRLFFSGGSRLVSTS